ncbi:DUF6199 family natural product biosynthesis protein [Paenibacillus terreus]|uniref:DUF6199 family natural product biosynthesis protein n=1 Tax=Paenibacillus terreus TaxID=1387834 RepID=A0ABV5BE16_9BACL
MSISSGIFLILFGLISIALGLLSFLKPSIGWYINEGWKVKGDSEPSETYLSVTRFGGIVSMMLGGILLFAGIMHIVASV